MSENEKKPFAVSRLTARFKKRAIDLAERAVEGIFDDVLDWVKEESALSSTSLDDMVAEALASYRDKIKEKIDFNKDGK